MNQDEQKRAVASAAVALVEYDMVVGVGTGSTANHFIDALAKIKGRLQATVASSRATQARLEAHGIRVLELNTVDEVHLYVDGADEATRHRHLIKGGGGALTREKIIAEVATRFVCIVDESKLVDRLGAFPLPVEVIAMARALVARRLLAMGGNPFWREGFLTDNGNPILDVHNLDIMEPAKLESEINQLVGMVTCGLFARRPADLLLVGRAGGVEAIG